MQFDHSASLKERLERNERAILAARERSRSEHRNEITNKQGTPNMPKANLPTWLYLYVFVSAIILIIALAVLFLVIDFSQIHKIGSPDYREVDIYRVLQIIVSFLGVIVTGALTYFIYKTGKELQKNRNTLELRQAMQTVNINAIKDDNFVAITQSQHPFGELSIEDTRRLYGYFLSYNVVFNLWHAAQQGDADANVAEKIFQNHVFLTYKYRHFCHEHVHTRGYNDHFVSAITRGWEYIAETNGEELDLKPIDSLGFDWSGFTG